jgi:hypothetical protein
MFQHQTLFYRNPVELSFLPSIALPCCLTKRIRVGDQALPVSAPSG